MSSIRMTAAASGDAEGVRSALGEVEEVFGRTESWPLHVIAEAQSMRRHLGDYQALLVIRRQLLNRPSVTPASAYLRRRLALFTADLTMFLGDLASAERQLARFSTELPEVAVSRARLQLLRGRVEEAQRTLETIRVPSGLQRVLLERELLGAIAAWQAGERDEAMFALDASLSRMVSTCGWGVLATVPYEPVLELAAAAAGRPGGRDLLQQLRELPETLRCLQIEQLTGAELRTLLTLAEGGSLEQTAGALFVSLNTVKFHLRRIYRKLRVSGREEAIRRAKRMGLIPSKASARQGGAENGVRGGPGGGKPVNTLG